MHHCQIILIIKNQNLLNYNIRKNYGTVRKRMVKMCKKKIIAMSYLNLGNIISFCYLSTSNQIHTQTQHPNT